jgi:uncharacterized protein
MNTQTMSPSINSTNPTNSTDVVNSTNSTDVVKRLYEAYAKRDIDAVLAELADDVDWAAEAASTSVPWYGPFRGRQSVPGFFAAIGTHVDVTEFVPVTFISNETDVVAIIRWTFTVKSTQRTASMFMQHWWRVVDGKIVFFRGSEDTEQSARAFAP